MRISVPDPYPGIRLDQVTPYATRAECWFARVCNQIPEEQSLAWLGAIRMIGGLEYHGSRFLEIARILEPYFQRVFRVYRAVEWASQQEYIDSIRQSADETKLSEALDNETIAYFNRMGQFYYFARSRRLHNRLTRINELMVFRHKHTAHRSIDLPRNETLDERLAQAATFGFTRLLRSGFPAYQIRDGSVWQQFHMANDHPRVMLEAADLMVSLHPCQDDA